MHRLCFITTIPITLNAFVLPAAKFLHDHTDWDITFICDKDDSFAASLPEYIHYIPIPMKRGISLAGIRAMFQMLRVFRREKFDLVQYSTPNASLYAALAAWLAGIPVRLYCQWGMAFVGMHGLKRSIFRFVEKTVCRLSTWIEPDSFGNLNFCHQEGLYPNGKGSVIWNGSASGVNLQKFDSSQKADWRSSIRRKYGIPESGFVYGFIGRINHDKGINELLSASRMILQTHEDAYLMLVGSPEIETGVDAALYRWAQQEPHVLFCGYTNVVEQYLSAMDVYVLPSYREGFGSAVIEAEAMGVPVIVTDIPGPTDAMKKDITGLVVKKADVSALMDAMETLYSDSTLCQKFADAGHSFAAQNFDQQTLFCHILSDRKRLLGVR